MFIIHVAFALLVASIVIRYWMVLLLYLGIALAVSAVLLVVGFVGTVLFDQTFLTAPMAMRALLILGTIYFVVKGIADQLKQIPQFQVTPEDALFLWAAEEFAEEVKKLNPDLLLIYDRREKFNAVPLELRKTEPKSGQVLWRIYVFVSPLCIGESRLASFKNDGRVFEVSRETFLEKGTLIKKLRRVIV